MTPAQLGNLSQGQLVFLTNQYSYGLGELPGSPASFADPRLKVLSSAQMNALNTALTNYISAQMITY
jgi:hypothetical protein